jgi:ribosome recycling factor
MLKDIVNDGEGKMKKTLELLKLDLTTVRAGRANPSILDKVQADYYGTMTPINQMANISAPEPRMMVLQPWDKSAIAFIEKAILKSDLGLNPSNDGSVIRIVVPQLTEERRAELVKVVKKKAEDARVSIRNIRRNINDQIKDEEKKKACSENDAKKSQEDIQKITDKYIKEVDKVFENKEKDIMEV